MHKEAEFGKKGLFTEEVTKINTTIKHEIMNLIISSAAIVFLVFSFLAAVHSGFTHQLGRLIDQILIHLGLMPDHIIEKLTIIPHLSYAYVNVNEGLFIFLNIIWGFIAFKLINKRGTRYSGWIYGLCMSLVFLFIASIYTMQSGDPFNWICVVFGLPVTLFIQILLGIMLINVARGGI